jgi:hypothetical protein
VGGVAWLVGCTGFAVALVLLVLPLNDAGFMQTMTCLAVWALGVGWVLGLFLVNLYPTVRLRNDRLEISAFWVAWIPVSWGEITDVRSVRWPPLPVGLTLIRARRITVAHRLYGWFFARTLQPGFVIRREMVDGNELLAEIRRRALASSGRRL